MLSAARVLVALVCCAGLADASDLADAGLADAGLADAAIATRDRELTSRRRCKNVKNKVKCAGPSRTIDYPFDDWLETEGDAQQRLTIPSLSQPFYNTVIDVRATTSAKDTKLIVSTAGNWQFALRKLLSSVYFPENDPEQESYLVTTSPPISVPQLSKGIVKVGNVRYQDAQPHVVLVPPPFFCGPPPFNPGNCPLIGALAPFIPEDLRPFPVYRNYGNVIFKLKGNDQVKTFADLARLKPGRFATATVGAITNYQNTIRGIFDQNPDLVQDICKGIETGDELVARLYADGVAAIGPPMHQSVPHVLVTGEGDAGLMFLELAVGIMRNNPVPTRRPRSLPRVDRAPLAGRLRGLLPRQGQGPRHLHEQPRRARARPGSLGRQRRRDDLRDEDHDEFDLPGLRRQLPRRPEVRQPDGDPRGVGPPPPVLEPSRPPSSTKAAPSPCMLSISLLQTLADGHSPPPPKSVTPRLGPTSTTPSTRRMSQNLTPHPA